LGDSFEGDGQTPKPFPGWSVKAVPEGVHIVGIIGIEECGCAYLFEIGEAYGFVCRDFGLGKNGKEDGSQDCNNGNDNE
jgi:hypothetical protein